MMKKVMVLVAFAAMVGASAAAATAGGSSLDMMMQRGNALTRCGPKGNGAKCPGEQCCSKFGFCGTTAFHCDASKGCQSQCRTSGSGEGGTEPQPVVAQSSDSSEGVQIVVKTISNAVPLCTDCDKASEESSEESSGSGDEEEDTDASDEDEEDAPVPDAEAKAEEGEAKAEDAAAVVAAAAAKAADNADNLSAKSDQLEAIRKIQATGAKQAAKIVADAKKAAEQITNANKRAGVIIPTGGIPDAPKAAGPLSTPNNVLEAEGY